MEFIVEDALAKPTNYLEKYKEVMENAGYEVTHCTHLTLARLIRIFEDKKERIEEIIIIARRNGS